MNLLLLFLTAITALFLVRGYRRGLFKCAVSTIGIALAVFLTVIIYPYTAMLISEKTDADDKINSVIKEKMCEITPDAPTRTEQMNIIDNLELNNSIKELLIENNNDEEYLELKVESFTDYVSVKLTDVIIRGIAYIITLLLMLIIVFIFVHFADIFTDIPIVRVIDKIGGLVLGLAESVVFIWILFLIIMLFSATEGGSALISMTEESPILNLLYENNLLFKIAVGLY